MLSSRTPADNRPITDVHDSASLHKSSSYSSNSSGMSVTTINTRIRILLSCFLFRQITFSIFWRLSYYILWFFVPFAYSTHSEYPIIRCTHLVTTSKTRSNKYSSLSFPTDPFKSNTLCNRSNSLWPQPSRQSPCPPHPPTQTYEGKSLNNRNFITTFLQEYLQKLFVSYFST